MSNAVAISIQFDVQMYVSEMCSGCTTGDVCPKLV